MMRMGRLMVAGMAAVAGTGEALAQAAGEQVGHAAPHLKGT